MRKCASDPSPFTTLSWPALHLGVAERDAHVPVAGAGVLPPEAGLHGVAEGTPRPRLLVVGLQPGVEGGPRRGRPDPPGQQAALVEEARQRTLVLPVALGRRLDLRGQRQAAVVLPVEAALHHPRQEALGLRPQLAGELLVLPQLFGQALAGLVGVVA